MPVKQFPFKDMEGSQWNIRITYAEVFKVENELGVDISQILTDPEQNENSLKSGMIMNIIYILCKGQNEGLGLEDENDFLARFDGDSVTAAGEALVDAIVNFIPAQDRQTIAQSVKLSREISQKTSTIASQKMQKILSEYRQSNLGSGSPDLSG